jgi:hypothetical protein
MPSTVVANMDYSKETKTLRIRFVSGLVYEYKQVPEKIFRAMQRAGSKGTFLNQFIKGHYDFEKID